MADGKPQFQLALESPRTITKRIESYITRGVRDEERRAQKALLLLKARDQQILLLERRVKQLENAAADMHAITLQAQLPTPDTSDKTSYFSAPQASLTTLESREKVDGIGAAIVVKDHREYFENKEEQEKKIDARQAVHVPELNFTSSPLAESENDVFSTPISPGPNDYRVERERKISENTSSVAISEEIVYFLRNESPKSGSSKQTSVDILPRVISSDHGCQVNSTEIKETNEDPLKSCNVNVDRNILSQISEQTSNDNRSLSLLMATAAFLQSKKVRDVEQPEGSDEFDEVTNQRSGQEVTGSTVPFSKLKSSHSVKLSPSVPWVRVKRRLRRKSRGHELGLNNKAEAMLRSKDCRRSKLGFESTSRSLPAVNDIFSKSSNHETEGRYGDIKRTLNTQGATLDGPTPRSDHETALSKKRVIIQTAPVQINGPSGSEPTIIERKQNNELQNWESLSRTTFTENRKSPNHWGADDEPAPQWLLEKAISRARELSCVNRYDEKNRCTAEMIKDISSMETKYEEIITELERKLNDVKFELVITHKKKNNLKEKFKRALENTKMEAMKENEILREKIVKICSSVLEKFGPYAFSEKKTNRGSKKCHKSLNRYGKLSRKLHRKLRSTLIMSDKLRDELKKSKELFGEKTREHECLEKRFTRLKQELETTELNLNDLINENSSLRKKFEDTREWMELRIGKERHERNNLIQSKDMQKSRDITNLKKKAEEDFATITQLRNKLLRSESANANKGFLLNSYKGQLADLMKEKEQSISKTKELENYLAQLKNNNAQLKAKISLLLNEKEKLVSENEKSESDFKEKMEKKLILKYEQSMLQEIETMKSKCDELLQDMRDKMKVAENRSLEYSAAISDFLRQLNTYTGDSEMNSSFAEGEASQCETQKTVCTILNMTPKELSGFMKGRPANQINTWLADFRKIISRDNFSEVLANFLFGKVSSSIYPAD